MKKLIFLLTCIFALSVGAADRVVVYHDAAQFPLLGKVRQGSTITYGRLPDSLENISRKPVWELGENCAGMAVRFASNSTSIFAKWEVTLGRVMNHMTPTGIQGLDLYALQDDGTWTFVNSGRPKIGEKAHTATIISDMEAKEREYMLFLPLYDGLKKLEIGVDSLSSITMPRMALPVREKPIVFYGTSILQGGCATRPGMCHSNILERMLNRETYNFGFSGNGQLDLEIAEVISSIDAGVVLLDFMPNVTIEQIDTLMEKFYYTIRDKRPQVPIIFVESPNFPHMRFNIEVQKKVNEKNANLRRHYAILKKAGEKNIYYVGANRILGKDHEDTVDGNHFTDLGFLRFAENLYPILKKVSK